MSKLTRRRGFRVGGGFETRVGRDHEDAKKKQVEQKVAEILSGLKVVGLADPDTKSLLGKNQRGGAATVVEQLWPRPPSSSSEHNDLAVAYAWLKRWDKALAELVASEQAPGASEDDRKRAAANRDLVVKARDKARG